MAHRKKDLLRGAAFGLAVLVVSEVARHLLGHDRSLDEMAWNLWVVPFGAVMWSIGRSARRRPTDALAATGRRDPSAGSGSRPRPR